MVKQTIILLVLYFLQFYLPSLRGKNLTNSQEPEPVFFGPLEPEPGPLEKKPGAGAAREKKSGAGTSRKKNQEPEPLEKLADSLALVLGLLFCPCSIRN